MTNDQRRPEAQDLSQTLDINCWWARHWALGLGHYSNAPFQAAGRSRQHVNLTESERAAVPRASVWSAPGLPALSVGKWIPNYRRRCFVRRARSDHRKREQDGRTKRGAKFSRYWPVGISRKSGRRQPFRSGCARSSLWVPSAFPVRPPGKLPAARHLSVDRLPPLAPSNRAVHRRLRANPV